MTELFLLSGGAARSLVAAVAPLLESETGCTVSGTFGAVGAMREKLAAGEPADLVILTRAIVDELAQQGSVLPETVADLGRVETAVAVRAGASAPSVHDADALRHALLQADEIFFPDPALATAGIHFAGVLDRLGIADQVRERIRVFPNGATAMGHLAASDVPSPIGCTQVTEILSTPGAALVGPLPSGLDLVTIYSAAVCGRARRPGPARRLVELLTAAETAQARDAAGFR